MKKTDFWRLVWIPVKKRLPPEDWKMEILTYNYEEDRVIVFQAAIARYAAIAQRNGEPVSWDRRFSHWCQTKPPNQNQQRKRTRNAKKDEK